MTTNTRKPFAERIRIGLDEALAHTKGQQTTLKIITHTESPSENKADIIGDTMATVHRFEDLDVWKKSRVLTSMIYQLTDLGTCARDYGFKDQVRRGMVSIMSNIAEGFERQGSPKGFPYFLSIAKGSAGEVRSHIDVAIDVGYFSDDVGKQCLSQIEEISRMLSGLMKHLETKY